MTAERLINLLLGCKPGIQIVSEVKKPGGPVRGIQIKDDKVVLKG